MKNRAVSSTMPTATSSNFVRTLRNSFRRRKKPDVRILIMVALYYIGYTHVNMCMAKARPVAHQYTIVQF